jgi:Transmembrane secretion effector
LIVRWKRPVQHRTAPTETIGGATVAALRFVRYSPSLRGMMLRSGLTMFFASALLALMPSIARAVSASPPDTASYWDASARAPFSAR